MKPWMIYGANGFTGKITAREATKRGYRPILAGRSREKIEPLAKELNLEYRLFDLANPVEVEKGIQGMFAVLLAAGPFSKTSAPMALACIKQKVHYLDITGEIEVFEHLFTLSAEAKAAGVWLLPGVGFDVVPSDCLAKRLSEALPEASELELAFAGNSKVSPGTLKTMLEKVDQGGQVRKNGQLVKVGQAHRTREVKFSHGKRFVTSIPWGDVSTAYHSTKIPNIVVYAGTPKPMAYLMKALQPFSSALATPLVQDFLRNQIEKRIHGPSEEEMESGRMHLWGRVTDTDGKVIEGRVDVPEGYRFTRDSSLAVIELLQTHSLPGGTYTPSMAFGSGFVETIPGTTSIGIKSK